jgi:hypothetical protein
MLKTIVESRQAFSKNHSLFQSSIFILFCSILSTFLLEKALPVHNYRDGVGSLGGYQAGFTDQGDFDQIINNSICGLGYTPLQTPPPYLFLIDITVTNNPTDSGNTSCLDGSPISIVSPGAHAYRSNLKPSATR